MKRLITSILMASAIAVGAADDLTKIVCINATSYTSTNLPSQSYNGFLDSVFVD